MNTILISIGILLIILGSFVILCNYIYLFKNWINKKQKVDKFHSQIPLFGALLLFVGLTLLPTGFSKYYYFVFAIDPGTVMFVLSLPVLIKEMYNRSK